MKKQPIVVIKLGTSSIVHEKTRQPLISNLSLIVETATSLRRSGYGVILVSSGAIGIALHQRGLPRRPKHLPEVQALAAIGQCRLMGLWDQLFDRIGQTVAQILLTRNDLADQTQYRNAQNTFKELLSMGVIPIVNENDTLSVNEIKFGDNDTLSAFTAGMVGADYLFLMTDVDCLYDKNPRKFPDAKPIEIVENISDLEANVSSAGSSLGTGGMATKIIAAQLATAAAVTTIITKASNPGAVAEILKYVEGLKTHEVPTDGDREDGGKVVSTKPPAVLPKPPLHTRFLPSTQPVGNRHFWLLHGLTPRGTIYVDHGAAHALSLHNGLLPVGVVDVEGTFAQQQCVRLVQVSRRGPSRAISSATTTTLSSAGTSSTTTAQPTPTSSMTASLTSLPARIQAEAHHNPQEIGRALANYSAAEIRRIAGLRSSDIASVLGYADGDHVALRGDVAMYEWGTTSRPVTPTKSLAMGAGVLGSGSGSGGESAAASGESPERFEGWEGGRLSGRRTNLGLGGYVEG